MKDFVALAWDRLASYLGRIEIPNYNYILSLDSDILVYNLYHATTPKRGLTSLPLAFNNSEMLATEDV
jgi:hypothetical protein